ncbi:hypothetical protein [Celerinatantimonas sp. YJH-8]|uniref:hypothetical protein n=1 Tax=Celerinatantimonas sp. YJH-8 TaxID=3228714 RepID=UPI0038C410CC
MIDNTSNTPIFNFDFAASEPKNKPNPAEYYTMTDYIHDLVTIDQDNSATATDTQLMITKYRKLYYNSRGWNDLLIPETANIATFSASAATQKVQRSHEVILTNGDLYDAAHIFAILDASNHNGPLSPIPEHLIPADLPKALKELIPVVQNRLMAAGWLGDLSEITGQFYQQNANNVGAKQAIVDQFGAYYKNLANVDGMVMTQHYDLLTKDGQKLSDIFTAYYGLTPEAGLRSQLKSSRYLDFATSIGLNWKDNAFENREVWLKQQLPNLRTCTAFYLVKDRGLHLTRQTTPTEHLTTDLKTALNSAQLSQQQCEFAQHLLTGLENNSNPIEDDLVTLAICFLIWIGYYDRQLSIADLLASYISGLAQAIQMTQSVSH